MINNVCLMGRLTDTPELRKTQSGISVTTFTVAVSRSFVTKGAERQTDFIDVVAWRQTAEFVTRYFKKGQMIALTGSIQTRTYQDKEGKNRKAFEVVADEISFTESRSSSSGEGYSRPAPAAAPAASAAYEAPASFTAGGDDEFAVIEGDDADLPF